MTDRELLIKIRERLVTKGWRQGGIGSHLGPNCLLGAIIYEDEANGNLLRMNSLRMTIPISIATNIPPEETGWLNRAITVWNDAEGRTFDEVLQVLDQAIAATEIQEETRELVLA